MVVKYQKKHIKKGFEQFERFAGPIWNVHFFYFLIRSIGESETTARHNKTLHQKKNNIESSKQMDGQFPPEVVKTTASSWVSLFLHKCHLMNMRLPNNQIIDGCYTLHAVRLPTERIRQ